MILGKAISRFKEKLEKCSAEHSKLEDATSARREAIAEAEKLSARVLSGVAPGAPPTPTQQTRSTFDQQTGIAGSLRYYTGGVGGTPRLPQQLKFNEAQLSADSQASEMRSEAARLATFGEDNEAAAELAAAGFYSNGGNLRCAFCHGLLGPRLPGESVMTAHARQFCTCPFVLRMDVRNVPIDDDHSTTTRCRCRPAVQCGDLGNVAWDTEATMQARGGRHKGLETPDAAALLTSAGSPIVSARVASVAAAPDILVNLETLEACAADVPPLSPELRDLTARQRTFVPGFSDLPTMLTDTLAEAGFSVFKMGAVACFSCGLCLQRWPVHEDPWVLHATWSPRCAHLLLARGAAFVCATRASMLTVVRVAADARRSDMPPSVLKNNHFQDEISDTAALSASNSGAVLRFRNGPRDVRARFDWPMLRDAQRILSLGAVPELRALIELQLARTGADFSSPEILLACALQLRVERLSLGLEAEDFLAEQLSRLRSAWPAEPPALAENDEPWRSCKVCLDRRVDVLLRDCGHLCCCSRCCRSLVICPICRSDIRAELLVRL